MVHAAVRCCCWSQHLFVRSLLLNGWLHWGCCEPFMCHQKQVSAFALLRIIVLLPVSNSPARRVLIFVSAVYLLKQQWCAKRSNSQPAARCLFALTQ